MTGEELWRHLEAEHPPALRSGKTGKPVMTIGLDEKIHWEPVWGTYHDRLHQQESTVGHSHDDRGEPIVRGRSHHGGDRVEETVSRTPSFIETLWAEMDRLMEGLMTGADAKDGGDKFRAQGTAFALAAFLNPAAPNVDWVHTMAVERWNEAQAE